MSVKTQKVPDGAAPKNSSVFSGAAGLPPVVMLALLLVVGTITGVVYGWRTWGRTVVARPIYRLAAENIQVTQAPGWIRTDVRQEVVRDGALNDLTIFDKDATIRVYQAFELHPWVAKVQRVSKHPPAKLMVDVEYRRPVAWVEVPGATPGDEGGVIPVDAAGVVLPSRDFTKDDLQSYLRISVRNVTPYGLAGSAWGDPRVSGAAKIARVLHDHARALQLFRIQIRNDTALASEQVTPVYEIETSAHARFVWGNPPGSERADEPSSAVKLNRLVQTLEQLAGSEFGDSEFDLRDANTLPAPRTATFGTPLSR